MATLTIRNLDDEVKRRLRIRAAEHGRSMEEEARDILRRSVAPHGEARSLAELFSRHFGPERGVDLPAAPRGPWRAPVGFD